MESKPEYLNLIDYAKYLCVSDEAIRQAIKSGRIPKSAITTSEGEGRGNKKRIYINRREADIAWVESYNPSQGRQSRESKQRIEEIKKELATSDTSVSEQEVKKHVSFNEARRRKIVAEATKTQIEVLQLQGILVEKKVVYKQLFEAAQILRDDILAIPDRISADILAADGNINEIRRLLTEALAEPLESLSELYTKNIG